MATDAISNQDLPTDSLMGLIGAVRAFCERKEAEIRAQSGLTEAQYAFLRQVPATGTIRTGDLCRRAGLSPSRGGRVIDELVQAGHLRRGDAEGDRRVQVLSLSPRGRAVRRRVEGLLCRCDEVLRQRLAPPELAKVLGGLRALVEVIEA